MSSKLSAIHSVQADTVAGRVFRAVKAVASGQNQGAIAASASYAFGNESFSESSQSALVTSSNQIHTDLVRALAGTSVIATEGQMAAATESMLMASNVKGALASRVNVTSTDNGVPFVGIGGLADAFGQRNAAFEAYSEQDNVNVLANTVTFNILAGRQNKAGELFFPTVTVPSDNVGVSVTIRLYQVHDDIKRNLSGAQANFNRKNIHRALIDHTILKNDTTKAVPVYRAESAGNFTTDVAAADVVSEGETIKTAPLAFGKKMDFLALSMTDTLLASGVMTREDSLDTAVTLTGVYLKVGANVIHFGTEAMALSNFIATGQDNYRVQKLNFETSSLVIGKNTKTVAKAALAGDLAGIVSGDLSVRLALDVNGSVNIESGDLVAHANGLTVVSIYDVASKQAVSLTTGTGLALKAAIEAGSWVGYDVKAYRSNADRRERGQLLDTTYYSQIWAVPLRSPLTALRPVNAPAQSDGADLECLASTTFARTSGAAITTLLDVAEMLQAQQGLNLDPTAVPETLGVARFLVKATFIAGIVEIGANVNNLSSHELENDIRAVLVNRIRDVAYRLYRDSEFQAVVESGAAGTTEEPTVICITDPMTARYLMIDGEVRTAGPTFALKVETTPDLRMAGKIAIALGYPEQSSNSVNSLHFGNMLWSPEIVLTLPISRDGKISKELTVQPRFRHIVNVPILGMLQVNGLPEVVSSRIPLSFLDVTP